ncbi:MAG: class I SAM-dependent methyltransferase [Deltaproteobacteria bacterium]|jgi:SAM-dependent methyltransferase|nr:class I SAM-dependent methyltransferase [Deltaproteobacteria bacterium]MBT4015694.1 class I SAM-dependent methyltransferase [Deltaproteobacteria bacterium]MBT4185362.1 class I SAM-dependent methyltransferase [Deltaproteobacteria bacterium]MBT5833828.1 class I SAM-dependent methyltransferase [Deltaproteobacteria bacterium]
MKFYNSAVDLVEIERLNIAHYDENAESFRIGTKDHDVSQNIAALLDALPKEKTLDILDFGCGPGRDMCVFKSMGHRPVGLDGSKEFCKMAVKQSGCPTLNQQFLKLELEENRYDGIFANASLFTVPSQELPRVLKELHSALRKDGILFSSNPRGNAEGWQGQRYGHYMEFEASETFLQQSGFKIIEHFYRPAGMPREHQPWLAIVSQRQEQK